MATEIGIQTFVLQELRLRDTADANEAARVLAAAGAIGTAVPLLTSIDDERDVAVVRAVYTADPPATDTAQRAMLERFVATWQPPQQYVPRITERSATTPAHYRLAVTGSGINNAEPDPIAPSRDGANEDATRTPLDLLWVGVPLGTYAGLLILLGTGDDEERPDARKWPLPLSRYLGVRIYDSQR